MRSPNSLSPSSPSGVCRLIGSRPYFWTSMTFSGGKLYLASEDGDVIVVKAGEKFEVLATNTLADQMFIATPAIMDGAIYLRGQKTLFCVR